jgi:hypothetical protein
MPSPESKKVSALIIFTKGNFLVTDIIEAIPNIAKISGSKKYPSPNMYLNPANTFSPTTPALPRDAKTNIVVATKQVIAITPFCVLSGISPQAVVDPFLLLSFGFLDIKI